MTAKKQKYNLAYPFQTDFGHFDITDKVRNAQWYTRYFLSRTQTMFEYEGLPETMQKTDLERLLQCNGFACVAERDGKLYAFYGGLGGEPNPYYLPTICTVANPALNFSQMFKIDVDCVIVKNDSYYNGLLPLINRYSAQLAENDISLRIADINARIISLITAPDGNTKLAAEEYIKKIIAGEIGIIADESFLDGIKAQPLAGSGYAGIITDLIELEQYLKASCYNELGINSNYNMKRESLNTEESQLNHDALIPFVEDMLENRQQGIEKVNQMFGTQISVKLGGVWRDRESPEVSGSVRPLAERGEGDISADESDSDSVPDSGVSEP